MNIISKLDDQLKLPEDEALLLENVRSFARNEIPPRPAHHAETGDFPWENIKAINELGLNAMFIPEAYGAAGCAYRCYLACVRAISADGRSPGISWAPNFTTQMGRASG